MIKIIFLFLFTSLNYLVASEVTLEKTHPQQKVHYEYKDRTHTLSEKMVDLSAIFGVSVGLYYLTQKEVVESKGSFENYKNHFGKLVFDKDNPFWNVMVHPFSGSQMYLFFRARGYARMESLWMSAIQSGLFEFFIETYTEPASYQDLYITPVYGSLIGYGIELVSIPMLNSGNAFLKVLGHIINPASMFWFFEGKVYTTPIVTKEAHGLTTHFTF